MMLTNPKQLLCSPLIRGKPSNLADQVAHKLVVLGQLALENVKVEHKISGKTMQTLALLGFGLRVFGVVLCPFSRPTQISYLGAILVSEKYMRVRICVVMKLTRYISLHNTVTHCISSLVNV